eukprot:3714823-Alexandrium_andersonii.AAC.1
MSASLVGSEMCIRDSLPRAARSLLEASLGVSWAVETVEAFDPEPEAFVPMILLRGATESQGPMERRLRDGP